MFQPPKVLVAAPVNSRKEYCIGEYLDNCLSLTYPNKQFYFVDNSTDKDWCVDNILAAGFDCDWVNPEGMRNQNYICVSQNAIRHKVLSENFEYLLFNECDIFVPHDIIEQLISYHAPVVATQYFINEVENTHLIKTEIEKKTFGKYTNRNIADMEGYFEHGKNKSRSSMAGFGCILLHRKILERFPFHVQQGNKAHSDTLFFFDIYGMGIKTIVHPVICKHLNSSWSKVTDA